MAAAFARGGELGGVAGRARAAAESARRNSDLFDTHVRPLARFCFDVLSLRVMDCGAAVERCFNACRLTRDV